MKCICDTCQNLKTAPGEAEGEIVAECAYGFPTDACETCTQDGCDATCEHFEPEPAVTEYTVRCAGCGKEMAVTCEPDDTPVYCMDCYLSR